MNGAAASNISTNLSFNNGTSNVEALVYVRDGQTGTSTLSGNITALDFTKFGPGTLEVSGSSNVIATGNARLPVLSVQEGTFRFANAGALFQNGSRGNEAGLFTLNVNEAGVFETNGLTLSIAGFTGNGTISGTGSLTAKNGFGVDPVFAGRINGTLGLTKTGNGLLQLSGFSTYSGGTTIEAGRVVASIPLANTNTSPGLAIAALGGIDVRSPQALGTGAVTLKGGILAFNNNVALAEVEDGLDFNTFGPGAGYDLTIASTGISNGIALPDNRTSTIYLNSSNTGTLTGNAAISTLSIDAPQLNIAGLATNSGNISLLFVKNATTFSQSNTVLNINGGRLFLGGKLNAAGKTITKIGAQDLVLTHTEGGVNQNEVGLWKVLGGSLNVRVADGASNPLGTNAMVELNGGTTGANHLNLNSDGNGTALAERVTTFQDTNVRYGSMLPVTSEEFVMTGASRINTDRVLGNNSNKTFVINNLEVGGTLGSAYVYNTGANGDNLWVNGTTTFIRDLYLQNDVALTLNGVISGQGTFVKRFGTNIYINADNTSGYDGGTILSATPLIFGSLEGNQVSLSDTAKLGKGHVIVNASGQLQFNSVGNLQADQNVYVSSNLDNFGVLRLAADLTLDQVRFRAAGAGGVAPVTSNYYLTNSNPGGGVLALNAIYTKALDLNALGDGTWFLGSTNNAVGANGAYDAATLAPGFNNTYRLGAGGSTLFFGTNGNSNVITDVHASTASKLTVGAPMSLQNNGVIGNGSGNVVFLTNQNYTGSTLINRLSTLDFRGTLNTSSIETYGGLNVAGETGTFLAGGSGAHIPVTLRPGATLRFDNTSAGVLPTSATQGRWSDTTAIALDNATLRLQGNAAVEVRETVGAISAKGGSFIEIVRGVPGRTTELRTPAITRVGNGTITFNTNSETLGSDERLVVTGTAPTVTNGMVAPWMITNTNTEFLTYNAATGFSKAGFTNIQVGGTTAATLNLSNDRVLFNTATTVIGTGFEINAYAARLDADLTLASASNNTSTSNRLVLGSGGLITTGTRVINAGLRAGSGGNQELLIFNTGTTTIGDAANATTSGQIAASSITKSGGGTLVLQARQSGTLGSIAVNQGQLTLTSAPSAAVPGISNGATLAGSTDVTVASTAGIVVGAAVTGTDIPAGTVVTSIVSPTVFRMNQVASATGSSVLVPTADTSFAAGSGTTTVVLNGANTQLNLLGGNDNFSTGSHPLYPINVVVGDYNPIVQIVADRAGGNISDRRAIIGGNFTFGLNTAETGQQVRFTTGNSYDIQLGTSALNTLTLVGKSVFNVDNGFSGQARQLYVASRVTGAGTLIKSRIDTASDLMVLENVNDLNDWSGGTLVAGGTLRVYAKAENNSSALSTNLLTGGLGNGTVTMMGGTLDLRLDADSAVNKNGTYTRTGTTITATVIGHGYVNGQRVVVTNISGQPVGTFNITSVADGNTFTYTTADSGSTSGSIATNGPDSNSERIFYGITGNGPDIVVNGSSTINVDRTGLILGGNNKQLAFDTLTIGSQILTVSGGNGYALEFAGGTTLLGNLFLNNGADTVFGGDINDGGANLFINKISTGSIWVDSSNNTLGGGAYINAGMLRFGTPRLGNAFAQLGTGLITIAPGAEIRLEGTGITNINTFAGQKINLVSTAYAAAILRTPAVTQAEYQQILTNTSNGQLALLGTQSNALDMSTLGTGRMYLGTVEADRLYNAASLAPGLADEGGINRVYRLGTRNSGNLIVNLADAGNLTDVGGTTDLRIGSLANLGPLGALGVGNVLLQDQNTYTGSTTVVRGSSLRFDQANSLTAGSLGALTAGTSAAAIHTYGVLRVEGTAGTFLNAGGTANAYTNITLHPGSELRFQDIGIASGTTNRWDDATPIALNGSLLTLQTPNAVVTGAETVGAITFDRGSRIQPVTQSTAQITLNAASLTRLNKGTMMLIPSSTGRLGLAPAANSERILVSGSAPTNAAGTNMLPGYFGVQVENRFATYGANGFAPVADGQMVGYAAGLPATAIVNAQANVTLLDNPSIFALRIGAFTLNSVTGASNDSTVTFAEAGGSMGGIITSGAAVIHPNLKFGSTGTGEALINTVGGNLTVNGNLTSGGVTKFGGNTLVIANDQSDAARGSGNGYSNGWVVNEGALQLGTFGSAGNAVGTNTITLNGGQAGSAQLNLRAQPQSTLLNYRYTFGDIIAVDNATIDFDPGADDRVHSIGNIEVQQSGGNGPVDAQLRFANNRARSILAAGTLTLTNNAIVNVDATADRNVFYSYNIVNNNLTTGTSAGISVAALSGTANFTKWGDGYMYIRGASPAFSGKIVIDQGAIQVNHNNALGTGPITINRYGILDIGIANYTPTNSGITYNQASVERWSVDGARTGTVNLGKGTLQVAVNQNGAANVILDGGSIEGWLRSDDVTETNRNSGIFRNLGENITFNLAGNSLVGTQFYEGANGLDMGKQTNDNRPMEEYFGSGVLLDIKGVISGGSSLTKVGFDTVILSAANTYSGGTNVNGGRVMIGRSDALAPTGNLSTTADGVLDLNGNDQTVAALSNPVQPAVPSTNSGYITNSSATVKTLTVGNGAAGSYAYSGVLQNNVAVNKVGSGTLELRNTGNTYTGKTTISAGKLSIASESVLGTAPNVSKADQLTLNGGSLVTTTSFALDDVYRGVSIGASGGTFEPASGTTFTVANAISGSGNLTKSGDGSLTLTAVNPLSGQLIINTGNVSLVGAGSLLNSTVNLLSSGTGLNVTNATGGTVTLGSIAGVTGSSIALGTKNLSVGGNNANTVFGGSITSSTSVSFTKTGTGTLTLTSSPGYTGETIILGGTLKVDSNLTSSSAVTATGGSLAGTGTLGNVTINAGGSLAPGADGVVGTITMNNLTMNAGASLLIDLNSTLVALDTISVVGTLTLDGLPSISFTEIDGTTPLMLGQVITLMTYGTAWNPTQLFKYNGSTLDDGGFVAVGSRLFQFDYNGGAGNQITLTNVANIAPSDIELSTTSVAENLPSGSTVATISGTDPNPGQSATLVFSLASGDGDTDNGSFTVVGNTLKTNAVFDLESEGSYSIRLRATDTALSPLSFEEIFVITVSNMNETPTITAIADANGNEDLPLGPFGFTIGDPESEASALVVTAVSSNTAIVPVSGISFGGSGDSRTVTVTPAQNAVGTATVTVKVSDGDLEATETFDVTLAPMNDVPLFTKGANQRVPLTVTATRTITGWATGIGDGDPEANEALTFNVNVTSGAGIFTALPQIDASGTLTYALTGSDGSATVQVTVTDDGTAGAGPQTSAAQTFTIVQTASENADLADLDLSIGNLRPGFASGTTAYEVTLASSVASVIVTPTGGDEFSTIEVSVNGGAPTTVVTGNASGTLPLVLGDNDVVLFLTAQDGTTTKTYTINFNRSTLIINDQAELGVENDVLTKRLNITGTPDGTLAYETDTAPQHGTVGYDSAGNFYYRPEQSYIGSDSFTYDVTDNGVYLGSATVTVSIIRQPPHWSWEGGSNLAKQKGTFPDGVLSVGTPGARGNMASWSNGAGQLYIFGGTGYAATTVLGALNDFWRCDLETQTWTWLGGSKAINGAATYGVKGEAAVANIPGARAGASSWIDLSGNLWLFGGGASSTTPLNDLWKFDGTNWTWISGSNTAKANGSYGTQGVSAPANVPSARSNAATWLDSTGKLYLFGGNGMAETGTAIALMNDLWRFDPVTGEWTWLSGSKVAKAVGVYGTKGVAASTNVPGARLDASSWVGRDGMLWLFGGSNNNDLWKYNPSANNWTWVSGSKVPAANGVYVARGVPDSLSEPAARGGARTWVGDDGSLNLFGGLGTGLRDDAWSYQPATGQWTWLKGSNLAAAVPVYGTLHVGQSTNTPGARQQTAIAVDASGDVWTFGGLSGANSYNDLFKLDQPTILELATLAASGITDNDATLNATVTANEFATTAFIRYATQLDMSGAINTPTVNIGNGVNPVAMTEAAAGLVAGTTYYYQVVATNPFGQRTGQVRSFATTGVAPGTTVQFASLSSNVGESAGAASIVITLSSPASTTTVIPVTVSGSANVVSDYAAPAATVTFLPGQTSASVAISIVDNALLEGAETIALAFGALPSGITVGANPTHTLTIDDDDQSLAISTPPSDQFIAVKDTLTLGVVATGSGPIKYQWKKNNVKIAGATSATYILHNATTAAAGLYTCDLSNPVGLLSTSSVRVFVVDAAPKSVVLAPGAITTFSVNAVGPAGTVFTYLWKKNGTTTVGTNSKTLSLSSLLAGDSGTYVCTVSAPGTSVTQANNGGDNVLRVTTLPSLIYPSRVVGSYLGLVQRSALVGGNLGARVDLTTTSAGGFTAKLTADGVATSLTSTLLPTLSGSTITAVTGRAEFVRVGKSTLLLEFTLYPVNNVLTNNKLTGTLTDVDTGESEPLTGFRNVWNSILNPADSYKDAYTFGLEIPVVLEGDQEVPQGNGYGAFTVSTGGTLTCAGATADGQAYTSAGIVGPTGQVPVFAVFGAPGGSILGTGVITPSGSPYTNNTFTGTLSWNRAAESATSKGVTYRNGFGPIDLGIVGGKYKAPAPGAVVMGLANRLNNARLVLGEGGLKTSELDGSDLGTAADIFVFSIRNLGSALVQTVTLPLITNTLTNYNKFTFTLAPSPQGLFSGTFVIPNATVSLVRNAKFNGMIVWTGSAYMAQGYFLLPQAPQSGQTVAMSPVLSGQIVLEAHP